MRVVAAAVIRRRRPRTRVPPRVLSVRLLRVARARCARVPADELRALELELGVRVERGPRDLAAEEPRAAAARTAFRSRVEERAHARRRVVAREGDEPLESVVPLAEVADDEADHTPVTRMKSINEASDIDEKYKLAFAVLAADGHRGFVDNATGLIDDKVKELEEELAAKRFPEVSIYCMRRYQNCNVEYNGNTYIHRGVVVLAFNNDVFPKDEDVSTVWAVVCRKLRLQNPHGCAFARVGVKMAAREVDEFADKIDIPLVSTTTSRAQGTDIVLKYCQATVQNSAADPLAAACLISENPCDVLRGFMRFFE